MLELDLHGYTRESALTELAEFISEARDYGDDKICVITGLGEEGGGILYHAVRAYLNIEGLSYEPAPEDVGGAGAVVVSI